MLRLWVFPVLIAIYLSHGPRARLWARSGAFPRLSSSGSVKGSSLPGGKLRPAVTLSKALLGKKYIVHILPAGTYMLGCVSYLLTTSYMHE